MRGCLRRSGEGKKPKGTWAQARAGERSAPSLARRSVSRETRRRASFTAVESARTYTYELPVRGLGWGATRATQERNRAQGFLSVDPLTRSYPMLTPYQYASNSPVGSVDIDGLESAPATDRARGDILPAFTIKTATELSFAQKALNWLTTVGTGTAGTAAMTTVATVYPSTMGNPKPYWIYPGQDGTQMAMKNSEFEIVTDDPRTLSNSYLFAVKQRIANGTASANDHRYAKEAANRDKARGSDGSGSTFTLLERDGNLEVFSVEAVNKDGEIENLSFQGFITYGKDEITIEKLDIEGSEANKFGLVAIRKLAQDFGRQNGVSTVKIFGAARTTGANPGKRPEFIFKVNE